jgi:hypothetical protein
MQWLIGSMRVPSDYQGRIFWDTTFLASPRMDLYLCLYSWLPKLKWLQHCTEQYQSTMNNKCKAIADFEEVEKLGQGFSSADPLEDIDIGDRITPSPIFVNKNMSLEHKDAIIKFPKMYVDYFAWNYHKMPRLS